MTTPRWQRMERIFAQTRELPAHTRAEVVARECGTDEELHGDVLSLMAADEALSGFLADCALDVLAQSVATEGWALHPGDRIGAYIVLNLLGSGGAGEVWRARDERLGREVAIKMLLPHFAGEAERLRRFADESRTAGALNHPNILTVHDVGKHRGIPFLVCECLEGQSLRQRIDAGAVSADETVAVALGVARGLAAAHARGIVHRDIKPENLFIRSDGGVKILDFGLAKLQSALDGSSSEPNQTMTGIAVGTAGYMSPEQVNGAHVDARTDLFALGVTLYEMLSGRHPFNRASTFDTLHAVITVDPPDLSTENGSVPAPLASTVMRLLKKNPDERVQSAVDLGMALEVASGRSETALGGWRQDVARAPSRRWTLRALTAALVLTAGAFAWREWRVPAPSAPQRAVPLTALPGVARHPSFSPDGNRLTFTWNGPTQDNPDVYVQQVGVGSPLRLTTDPANDHSPVFSPDGRWIGFLRGQSGGPNELRLIPSLGGPERKLGDIRPRGELWRFASLAWCPDSSCILATDSAGDGTPDALFAIAVDSAEKRQLTAPRYPAAGDTDPAISPDGSWLVFRRNLAPFIGDLYRLPLGRGVVATGEPHRLTLPEMDASSPAWMPDSKEILFSAKGSLWRLAVSGAATPARLPFVGEDGLMPAVSRAQPGQPARLIYVRSFVDSNIWRVQTSAPGALASSEPAVAISSTRGDNIPQFSPDGRRVAFTSSRSGDLEIWLADADGANAVQLTSMGAVPGFPRWSPDGELVAFHSNPEGQAEVYVIPAAGGKPRNLSAHPATDAFPSFSRDGRWVYFSSNRGSGNPAIWKVPSSGGEAVLVTNTVGHAVQASPDGAYLYYLETTDRPSPLWQMPVSGGTPVKLLDGVVLLAFAVIDGGIYYIDRPDRAPGEYLPNRASGDARLQYFDLATRRSRTVATSLGNVGLGLTVSPDGRTILYSRVDSAVDDLMLVENFR